MKKGVVACGLNRKCSSNNTAPRHPFSAHADLVTPIVPYLALRLRERLAVRLRVRLPLAVRLRLRVLLRVLLRVRLREALALRAGETAIEYAHASPLLTGAPP